MSDPTVTSEGQGGPDPSNTPVQQLTGALDPGDTAASDAQAARPAPGGDTAAEAPVPRTAQHTEATTTGPSPQGGLVLRDHIVTDEGAGAEHTGQ